MENRTEQAADGKSVRVVAAVVVVAIEAGSTAAKVVAFAADPLQKLG